jgi:AhpD family alkylhydroperoxidase
MTTDACDKPIWTVRTLAAALPDLPGHLRRVLPTLAGRPISQAFRERLMLAVAAENRCWYCQTAHRLFGAAAGVPLAQAARLLRGEDDDLPERERLALGFVRDLARRGFRSRDEALWEELGAHWSDAERAAIESTAHVMNLANRFGNTFDAARARAIGRCREGAGARAGLAELALGAALFVPGALAALPAVGAAALVGALRRP